MYYLYEDIRINYEVIGNGVPILILHGLGCDMELMKACMEPVFAKCSEYRRIYIDLPGMGKSEGNLSYASSDRILDILEDFAEHTIEGDFLVVGESYGGYLARGILLKFFERVKGMMLLCPVVEPDKEKRKLPEKKVRFEEASFLETLSQENRENFCEYAVIANRETYRRYTEEIMVGVQRADRRFVAKLEESYCFSFDVDEKIRKLRFEKPVLFLSGRQDYCVGYEDLLRIFGDYPRASFSILDMAGHNLQIEQPRLFGELMREWIFRSMSYVSHMLYN